VVAQQPRVFALLPPHEELPQKRGHVQEADQPRSTKSTGNQREAEREALGRTNSKVSSQKAHAAIAGYALRYAMILFAQKAGRSKNALAGINALA